ncbi:hypothetical protein ACIA59_24465 [Micromonospora haikouensis]|uniref:hypothetical protein n=1 Tax=Micromonospora haikouensis TaxID=686309 RepID=UPI00378ABD76
MSAVSGSPAPHELAAELGRRSHAVLALVTLSNHGEGTIEQLGLDRACRERRRLGEDLSWLAAVGLVRRDSPAGTWDIPDPGAVYRLSALGAALADSLAALAHGCGATPAHRPIDP